MMPRPDQRRVSSAPAHPALLSAAQLREPSNADVLRALTALAADVAELRILLAPQRSPLTLDPDEIAQTMAQLRKARPISMETPP